MGRIGILPAEVAEKIAAGEVVQRPVHVVKELVENALDAVLGARAEGSPESGSIQVEVRGGGLDLIRVADDGIGIPAEELDLAVARHGTSKLRDVSDLTRVGTLGFRGEALPSIGAVSELTLLSRPAGGQFGSYLVIEDGSTRDRGVRGSPPGTQVTVRHLFANLPARLAFQRSAPGEAAQVAHLIGTYALAYPELRFQLVIDGRTVLRTLGAGMEETFLAVHGTEAAEAVLPVDMADPAGVAVRGLTTAPELTRGTRTDIALFVNRRPIADRSLIHAVVEAYRGFLADRRFPIAALRIELDPAELDVNVHPTKAEVRFRRERLVYAAIQRATRAALLTRAPVPAVRSAQALGDSLPLRAPLPAPPPERERAVRTGSPAPAIVAEPPPQEADSFATRLPLLRIMGQVHGTYIVCEGPDGIYFLDQHAAHERVLYERVCAQRGQGGVDRQLLLEPRIVELSARRQALLHDHADELGKLGFEAEPFGSGAALIRAVPAELARADPDQTLLDLLDALGEGTPSADGMDRAAATIACHAAVRAGDSLTPELMRQLVQQLENTDVGRFCPHGRPTVVRLPTAQLARDFGRR